MRTERAPAKTNLGLRVLGRRDDGYHLLETLIVPLDLFDDLRVSTRPASTPAVSLEIERDAGTPLALVEGVPTDGRNLAHRAAAAFLEAAGLSARVEIRLTKRIPAAAGLGGGSSDAGAVLRALASLHPGAVPADVLAATALRLGAEVPFFLAPRPALVEGIGERIRPLGASPKLSLVLANPGVGLSTADVFRAFDALDGALTRSAPGSTLRALSDLLAVDPGDGALHRAALERLIGNDLEGAALRLCPAIGRLRRALADAGALAVGLSGSGATVFGVFADRPRAEAGIQALAPGACAWVRLAVAGGAG